MLKYGALPLTFDLSEVSNVSPTLGGEQLRAVALGAQQIKTGDADIIVAGGQENMSLSKHVAHLRNGQKMGALELVDSMIKDGLWDAFNGYHMGNTAENVARQWQITREEQDFCPLMSYGLNAIGL